MGIQVNLFKEERVRHFVPPFLDALDCFALTMNLRLTESRKVAETQRELCPEDFSPRISRISRMENRLILIRAIREIRGKTSSFAPLRLCDSCPERFRGCTLNSSCPT